MPASSTTYIKFSPFFVTDPKMAGWAWDKFNSEIDQLPPGLKDTLLSVETAEAIKTIGLRFNLTENYMEELAKIVRDVIMGYLFIGDMPSRIVEQTAVNTEMGQKIANELVNKLFVPVLDDLKKIQKEKFANRNKGATSDQELPDKQFLSPPPKNLPTNNGTNGDQKPRNNNVVDLKNPQS